MDFVAGPACRLQFQRIRIRKGFGGFSPPELSCRIGCCCANFRTELNSHIKPYNSDASKKEEVAEMFNNISGSYDFLNRFFSLGIDVIWRKKALQQVKKSQPDVILDMATGTADFAILAARQGIGNKIIGMDISAGMIEVGNKKIHQQNLQQVISLRIADSESIPLNDASVDVCMVAFGVRNFQDLQQGLKEIFRVLKPHGRIVVLEFSKPTVLPVKWLFGFYFKILMPFVGRWISKDKRAYSYLPESVDAFPCGEDFLNQLRGAGFQESNVESLSGGIASIYCGSK